MRIPEAQVHHFALHGSFETDALNLELFDKTFTDPANHVVHQRAAQSVQRFGLGIFSIASDDYLAVCDLQAGAAWQVPIQFALGSFDRNVLAFDFHLDLGRDGNGLFTNARHKSIKVKGWDDGLVSDWLPDVTEQFAADVFLARLGAGHQAFGG